MGLCCTPAWRDSLEYIKTFKNETDVTVNSFICIILKAFEEEEIDMGWALTQNLFNIYGILPVEIFTSWFDLYEKNANFKYWKVLEFLKDNECVVKEDLAKLICEKFKQFGSKVTTTTIYHSK